MKYTFNAVTFGNSLYVFRKYGTWGLKQKDDHGSYRDFCWWLLQCKGIRLSPAKVMRIERGELEPKASLFFSLCDAMGSTVDQFLDRDCY